MYLRMDGNGQITQLRIYKHRNPVLDIDWGHRHGKYAKGTPHVQEWKKHSDGSIERMSEPRGWKAEEVERFAPLLKKLGVRIRR